MVAYKKPKLKQELKERLILSLENSSCRDREEVSVVISRLKKPDVILENKESDIEKAIQLFLMLLEKHPDLLDHMPAPKASVRRGR